MLLLLYHILGDDDFVTFVTDDFVTDCVELQVELLMGTGLKKWAQASGGQPKLPEVCLL